MCTTFKNSYWNDFSRLQQISAQSEDEEGFVDVVAYLPADTQAAEPMQVGEGSLHGPGLDAPRPP